MALAGTRGVPEHTTRYSREGSTGEGTTRQHEETKIDPNKVRGLPPGGAFVISKGRVMRAQIFKAPMLSAPLPEAPAKSAGSSHLKGGASADLHELF